MQVLGGGGGGGGGGMHDIITLSLLECRHIFLRLIFVEKQRANFFCGGLMYPSIKSHTHTTISGIQIHLSLEKNL